MKLKSRKLKCAHSWKTVGITYVKNHEVTMLKSYKRKCGICGRTETIHCAEEVNVSLA